ncbi:subtilisin ase 1 [Tubulinosema ratisbonensis]|uniref:Subtilisin ase 1 n=1 Tax=Tubulinosema ratisbonensis TaxID=291195 RepID=A0A437AQC0_9MICR|nr:subtilisin ase 1 [Tubulinosema ratisbonensis]
MFLFFILSLCRDNYIVILKNTLDPSKRNVYSREYNTTSHFKKGDSIVKKTSLGYIANLSKETADSLQNDPEVVTVEEDKIVKLFDNKPLIDVFIEDKIFLEGPKKYNKKKKEPWGLGRISGTEKFVYPPSAGEGVDVYVLDTGIEKNHDEFEDRAEFGINLVEDSKNTDENGHGTHVAGTIAGKNVGVAKKARVIGVKVLDKEGLGMISRVILGLDYVIREHSKKLEDYKLKLLFESKASSFFLREMNKQIKHTSFPKTVVNMSVGGLKSKAMEYTIQYASSLGIHFSVAAGNDHEDACDFSPGSSKNAITVGASDKKNRVAFFSNYGMCVDLFAPGVEIYSAWPNNSYKKNSGTSMASPHVAGVMALFLGEKNYSPNELVDSILNESEHLVCQKEEYFYDDPNFDSLLPFVSIKKLLERSEVFD